MHPHSTLRVQITCKVCGTLFESLPLRNRKYCSLPCAVIGKRRSKPYRKDEVYNKSCAYCGVAFTTKPYKPNSKYCSLACARKRTPHVPTTCAYCGKALQHNSNRKFCSRSCAHRKFCITTICLRCGNAFEHSSKRQRKYCSKACLRNRIEKACEQCGQLFESGITRQRKYCSVACQRFASRNQPKVVRKARIRNKLEPRYLRFTQDDIELFTQQIIQTATCWIWNGARDVGNYGRIFKEPAHRVAFFLASGKWPGKGERILHTCDNTLCVRNDDQGIYTVRGVDYPRFGHLWIGSPKANSHDMSDKGRGRRTAEFYRNIGTTEEQT